jgi:hypothetical protein
VRSSGTLGTPDQAPTEVKPLSIADFAEQAARAHEAHKFNNHSPLAREALQKELDHGKTVVTADLEDSPLCGGRQNGRFGREREPRFLRPLNESPYRADVPVSQTIREAQAIYRPEKAIPGLIYANRQMLAVLAQVGKVQGNTQTFDATGISLSPLAVKRVAGELSRAAFTLRYGPGSVPSLLNLRSTLIAAAKTGTISVVDAGAGRSLSEVIQSIRHELHHRIERDLDPEAAREFLSDPVAYRAARTLVAERGYRDDPVELASEIGAHLHSGELDALDLTPEQGQFLWRKYLAPQPASYPLGHVHPIMK